MDLPGNEQMMPPDQKPHDRDRHAGKRDEAIAENGLARKARDHFADHAHAGKNHDVDGGMRVEPEQVLEKNRVAADVGIEDSGVQECVPAPAARS